MKKFILGVFIFGLGILFTLIVNSIFPRNAISSVFSSFSIDTSTVLVDVNNFREQNGLSPLLETPTLCSVAKARLSETRMNFSHDGFTASRFCAVNCTMGENLARNYKSEQEIVDAWAGSPSHKTIMLMPNVKYGCVASDGQYTVLNVSTMIPY
jgi:uncharacterized protein YkwD